MKYAKDAGIKLSSVERSFLWRWGLRAPPATPFTDAADQWLNRQSMGLEAAILMLLAPALIGMVSNRLPPVWGLLLLPLYLLIWIVAVPVTVFYLSAGQVGPPTLKDLINNALFMLFPLILLNGPPFLVGRYVPQAVSFVRRRFHSERTKGA